MVILNHQHYPGGYPDCEGCTEASTVTAIVTLKPNDDITQELTVNQTNSESD